MAVDPRDPADVFVVAIDGPAGAGKSTVGRALAGALGLEYLDTGAMYRAVTVAALRAGVALDDLAAVAGVARAVRLDVGDSGVFVDGVDVTREIRTPAVDVAVSAVAANAAVRADLVERQRAWARSRGGGVLEGRDIGTVVFPDAVLKVYLTAAPEVRAQRRHAEAGGDLDEILRAIVERDRRDLERADGPLAQAERAVVVDTTGRPIADVLEQIVGLLPERNGAHP